MRKNLLAAILMLHSTIGLADTDAADAPDESSLIDTGKIVVNVEGFESNRGTCRLMLYDSAKGYLKNPIRAELRPIRQRRATFELEGLPYGVYALVVWQEQERDARPFDMFANTPYRPVAFSNNARIERGQRGPPSFDKVKFSLDAPEVEMTLELFQ